MNIALIPMNPARRLLRVLVAGSRDLARLGQGAIERSNDPDDSIHLLRTAVDRILAEFPSGTGS